MHEKITGRKHLFFDLDDTVTPSRSSITPHMEELLLKLNTDIVVVSGAEVSRIKLQLGRVRAYALGQNGSHAVDPEGNEIWYERLTPEEVEEVCSHVEGLCELGIETLNREDYLENRGAQVSFSLMGHNAPIERKRTCDPDTSIRRSLLDRLPFASEKLEVRIGGTTTFDYFRKGSHKGTNVDRFIKLMGWEKDKSIYLGDRIFPGGNDEAVVGYIDTLPVKDSEHTYELLKKAFGL